VKQNSSLGSSWRRLELNQLKEKWQRQNCQRKKLSNNSVDKTVKLNFAAKWQVKATKGGENHKRDRVDLPTDEEEVQPRRLHKESQPLEQLDEVIEEIRRLMLRSASRNLPARRS
jgi:hypothetical protein